MMQGLPSAALKGHEMMRLRLHYCIALAIALKEKRTSEREKVRTGGTLLRTPGEKRKGIIGRKVESGGRMQGAGQWLSDVSKKSVTGKPGWGVAGKGNITCEKEFGEGSEPRPAKRAEHSSLVVRKRWGGKINDDCSEKRAIERVTYLLISEAVEVETY